METPAMTTRIEDLDTDVLLRVLSLLDGHSLAAATCTVSLFRSLADEHDLWKKLCLSTWPSLHHLIPHHRSLFSDAFPFPSGTNTTSPIIIKSLISAVDLYFNDDVVFSGVIDTDTTTSWFLGSPFRLDALDRNQKNPTIVPNLGTTDHGLLSLSWILIDPEIKRAVNVSSRVPVSVERHWHTGEVEVRFATVIGGGVAAMAVVSCEGEEVREVRLTLEDEDGVCLKGEEGISAVGRAAVGGRRRTGEERERYAELERRKRERKEKKRMREGRLDLWSVLLALFLSFSFLLFAFL